MKTLSSRKGFIVSVWTLALILFSIGSMTAQVTSTPPPVSAGKIAFLSTRDGTGEIYVMDADGSNPTRLTHSVGWPPTVHMPAVSPDGTKVVFTRFLLGDPNGEDIYVMDADGSNEIRLANSPGDDYQPDWSPDGRRIAFCSKRDGNYEIYVMNADGSNQTNLTNDPKNDYNPAWSPDGSKIAFDSDRNGSREIFVMRADGLGQLPLTTIYYNFDPTWSPDGARLAFTSWRWTDSNSDIVVMNADGSKQTRLTHSPSNDGAYFPSWSPDGTWIAFCAGNSVFDIYAIDTDGSNRIDLTNTSATDVMPNWQKLQAAPSPVPVPTVSPVATPNVKGSR